MKKYVIVSCVICVVLLSFGLVACGSKPAKITGLCVGVGNEDIDPFVYGNGLWDEDTLFEGDYVLQVGENYLLGVTYAQRGGSILNIMNSQNVSLKYDEEVLEIAYSKNEGAGAFYNLICKKQVTNTAIIVEVGKYSYTVIISAN